MNSTNNINKLSLIKKSSFSSTRKKTVKSPKSRKDPKEINTIIKEKNKLEIIKSKLSDKKQEISDCKEDIKKLFTKSNNKETELKNYIADLNSKVLNVDIQYDDRIDEMHKNIMVMISEIQEKIKMEINFTKKEMEKEVVNKFMEAELNQQKLMAEKIEEQKKVYERMSNTRGEIEKIRKHFEQTNLQCESLSKENENLRINLQSLEEDNESLEKKLNALRKEYIQVAKEHKALFINEEVENPLNINFDEEEELTKTEKKEGVLKNSQEALPGVADDTHSYYENSYMLKHNSNILNHQEKKLNLNIVPQDANSFEERNEYMNNPEAFIESLQENIKYIKQEHTNLHRTYIEEIKQRNEAQQLIQKCIEDLKLEINKVSKEILSYNKGQNNEELLNAKQNHMQNLENKLRVLTFVYDNGFQNTKMKKNKLLTNSNRRFDVKKLK